MNLVDLISAASSDYVASLGVPISSLSGFAASEILGGVLRKRAEKAREVLITELRYGRATLFDVEPEEAVSVVYRYFRAATEGAARLNLGLLGSCIANGTGRDSLRADEFLRWADVLASLSREEIHLLACLRAEGEWTDKDEGDWEAGVWASRVGQRMTFHFGYTEVETIALFAALMRTGCVALGHPKGGLVYTSTPICRELLRLVDVEGVMGRHSGGRENP